MASASTQQQTVVQTVEQLLARARSAAGRRSGYRLGGGATDPDAPSPLDVRGECDCSGFVCWALRVARYQPQLPFLTRVNGGWLNTDGIWWDAVREPDAGLFTRISAPRPGALVVYPSLALAQRWVKPSPNRGRKVGHVGIVTAVDPLWVIHCSAGNERAGDAIAETDSAAFDQVPYRAYAWFTAIDGGPHA